MADGTGLLRPKVVVSAGLTGSRSPIRRCRRLRRMPPLTRIRRSSGTIERLGQAIDLSACRHAFVHLVGVAVDDLPLATFTSEYLGDAERIRRGRCARHRRVRVFDRDE